MNHVTIGFYGDGSFKYNVVAEEDLESHIEYNRRFRPGRMLFVDGEYICGGCLKEEYKQQRIEEHKERIKDMHIDTSQVTRPYV